MAEQSNYLLNISVLYRNTQKYFDRALIPYDIGSGQLIFLLCINENEGITMQELTQLSEVDKGTTTKSIQRLIDQGYITASTDEKDRRVKRLYTTEKASAMMTDVYDFRNQMRTSLARDVDFDTFEQILSKVTDNARKLPGIENEMTGIKIGGMQKMTLLDYPGKVACTIFTAGCNFKCPFCHNRELVFIPENYEYFDSQDVLDYLEKRKGLLDGVCISGGEPLLQENLESFIAKIRELGYKIKIIPYQQKQRRAGKSKNNFSSLFDLAMLSFTSYTKIGLRLASFLGVLVAGFSFMVALIYFILKLIYWDTFLAGTAPILIGMFFLGAVQLIFLGLIGEYILSINARVMKRPLVIEEERINFEDKP